MHELQILGDPADRGGATCKAQVGLLQRQQGRQLSVSIAAGGWACVRVRASLIVPRGCACEAAWGDELRPARCTRREAASADWRNVHGKFLVATPDHGTVRRASRGVHVTSARRVHGRVWRVCRPIMIYTVRPACTRVDVASLLIHSRVEIDVWGEFH